MSGAVSRCRPVAALLIAAALVLSVPVADALIGRCRETGEAASGHPIVSLGKSSIAGDPLTVLDGIEVGIDATGASVPSYFVEEVGLPEAYRDVRVDDTGHVVGCVVDGRADEVIASIVGCMENRGWTTVPLGQAEGATFMKAGGACTWVLATCTQVGDSTSVVYRCATM